jgi:CelD/BcsL family acetyltransferase involved in cellulose biosynthesis
MKFNFNFYFNRHCRTRQRMLPTRSLQRTSKLAGETLKRIRLARSAAEMDALRPLWIQLCSANPVTMFQGFVWNSLAAQLFAQREAPYIVCVETDSSVAIIPAVIRKLSRKLAFLGEELFDYRDVLTVGDESALRMAWGMLATLGLPFELKAVRGEIQSQWRGFDVTRFSGAPFATSNTPQRTHPRLQRKLATLLNRGCELASHQCAAARVGKMYRLKADQDSQCLFRDPTRVRMIEAMVETCAEGCELLALERDTELVASALSFRDRNWRRFYGTYYSTGWGDLSPGVTLVNRLLENTMRDGLHLDLMTGEQPYKIRLAQDIMPLFRISADAARLVDIANGELAVKAA